MVVAPAAATLSGLRVGVANTPVTAISAAMAATAAIPIPARERRTPDVPARLEPPDRPRAGWAGRACGVRVVRSCSGGCFGMMVRR
jgi:hypothetical protein